MEDNKKDAIVENQFTEFDIDIDLLKRADKTKVSKKKHDASISHSSKVKWDELVKLLKNPIAIISFLIIVTLLLVSLIYSIKNRDFTNKKFDSEVFGSAMPVWKNGGKVSIVIDEYNPSFPLLNPLINKITNQNILYEIKQEGSTWILTYSPIKHLNNSNLGILGFDQNGRDVFTLLWVSIGYLFLISIIVTVIDFIIGFVIAAQLGFRKEDKIQARLLTFIKVMNKIPSVILFIPIMFVFKDGLALPFIIASFLFGWAKTSTLLIDEFSKFRDNNFIVTEKAKGSFMISIAFKHSTPILMHKMWVIFLRTIPQVIISQIILSMFGFNSSEIYLSFGNLIFNAINNIKQWWQLLFPTLLLTIFSLSIYFLSDSIEKLEVKYGW